MLVALFQNILLTHVRFLVKNIFGTNMRKKVPKPMELQFILF